MTPLRKCRALKRALHDACVITKVPIKCNQLASCSFVCLYYCSSGEELACRPSSRRKTKDLSFRPPSPTLPSAPSLLSLILAGHEFIRPLGWAIASRSLYPTAPLLDKISNKFYRNPNGHLNWKLPNLNWKLLDLSHILFLSKISKHAFGYLEYHLIGTARDLRRNCHLLIQNSILLAQRFLGLFKMSTTAHRWPY